MSNVRLTAVLPVRNRSGQRLENCLRSLRWQDMPQDQLEILISDFGSTPEHLPSIRKLAKRYNARLVQTHTEEVWNRSKVLNIGVQAALGSIVFCTDVDMIFAPNFLSTALRTYEAHKGQVMVLCRCHDLPEDVPEQLWSKEDYPGLHQRAKLRQTSGTGACQVASKAFFHHARGYDEKFLYWGAEDVDMTFRAGRHGLKLEWMDDAETAMLHQWHATTKNDRRMRFHINRWRYRITRYMVTKNRRGWGFRV